MVRRGANAAQKSPASENALTLVRSGGVLECIEPRRARGPRQEGGPMRTGLQATLIGIAIGLIGATTARAGNPCIGDAKATFTDCKADCKEAYQAAKDACRNKDHVCMEGCRA